MRGFSYKEAPFCQECLEEKIREGEVVTTQEELEYILDGADTWNGEMERWPVRDADNDYVLVCEDGNGGFVVDYNGKHVYWRDYKPRFDDPAREIKEDVWELDIDDDLMGEGIECVRCHEDIISPFSIACAYPDCHMPLLSGEEAMKLNDEHGKGYGQFCENHELELQEAIDKVVREEIRARFSWEETRWLFETMDKVYMRSALSLLLDRVFLADIQENTVNAQCAEIIKAITRQIASDKPWEAKDYDLEHVAFHEICEQIEEDR